MTIRNTILRAATPVSRAIGKLHFSPSHRMFKAEHYDKLLNKIELGDVILSRMKGEFNNLFIPGYWTHAAIFIGVNQVVEAVDPRIVCTHLMDFCFSKDDITLMRYKEIDFEMRKKIRENALNLIGKPYDFQFCPANDAFFCSELVAHVLNISGIKQEFAKRETLGVLTVTPQDFAEAQTKFTQVYYSFNPIP